MSGDMDGDMDGWIPAVERLLPAEPDTDLDDADVELQSRGWNPFARSAARVRELDLDPALLQRSLDDITAKLGQCSPPRTRSRGTASRWSRSRSAWP